MESDELFHIWASCGGLYGSGDFVQEKVKLTQKIALSKCGNDLTRKLKLTTFSIHSDLPDRWWGISAINFVTFSFLLFTVNNCYSQS